MNWGAPIAAPDAIAALVLVALAAAYDLRLRRIPNVLTACGVAAGIALNMILFGARGAIFSMLGLSAAGVVYLGLYALRAVGAGDAKLMAALGAIVGWRNWIGIFLCTAIMGGVAAIALALARGGSGKRSRTWGSPCPS